MFKLCFDSLLLNGDDEDDGEVSNDVSNN